MKDSINQCVRGHVHPTETHHLKKIKNRLDFCFFKLIVSYYILLHCIIYCNENRNFQWPLLAYNKKVYRIQIFV